MDDNKRQQSPRIALNFDLWQDVLKAYGYTKPLKAYRILGEELEKLNYEKRQQSSWITIEGSTIDNIILDFKKLQQNPRLDFFAPALKHITATSEDAILDLMPYFKYRNKSLIDDYNKMKIPIKKDYRAIHFDLSMKEVDKVYGKPYRWKPYYEIRREFTKLDFLHQQGSGYISKDEITVEDFAYVVQTLNENIPNLKKVIKHIDATQLSSVWNLMEYINPEFKTDKDVNYIDPIAKEYEKHLKNEVMDSQALLQKNKLVRYKEEEPDILVGKKFSVDNEVYTIKDLKLYPNGMTKDIATLERASDGKKIIDYDFASNVPLKINDKPKAEDNYKKFSADKVKSK